MKIISMVSANLKQNKAQSAHAESKLKGVNQRSNDVTEVQQQTPESPTVTLNWHACTCVYKVHKLHQRYSLKCNIVRWCEDVDDDDVELHVLGCRLTY